MGPSGYDTIGPYKSGVWLVYNTNNGQAAYTPKQFLPKQGSGYKYYFLGGDVTQAQGRVLDAVQKFGLRYANEDIGSSLTASFSDGQPHDIPQAPTGLAGALKQIADAAVIPPLGKVGAAIAGGGGAAAGADAAAGGAAGAAIPGLAGVGAGDAALAGLAASVGAGIQGVFNQGVKDAKYAALLVVVLFAGAYLLVAGGRSVGRNATGQQS